MVLLWWPLTAETTVATGPKRVFHAGPTMTCARVSGEKCNGSCFCLSRRWIPVVEANPGHGGPSAERDQTTEIRSGPAGDGGFTVNTVLEDTTPAILRDTRLWISLRSCLGPTLPRPGHRDNKLNKFAWETAVLSRPPERSPAHPVASGCDASSAHLERVACA